MTIPWRFISCLYSNHTSIMLNMKKRESSYLEPAQIFMSFPISQKQCSFSLFFIGFYLFNPHVWFLRSSSKTTVLILMILSCEKFHFLPGLQRGAKISSKRYLSFCSFLFFYIECCCNKGILFDGFLLHFLKRKMRVTHWFSGIIMAFSWYPYSLFFFFSF